LLWSGRRERSMPDIARSTLSGTAEIAGSNPSGVPQLLNLDLRRVQPGVELLPRCHVMTLNRRS
jgi:hypothetical protein